MVLEGSINHGSEGFSEFKAAEYVTKALYIFVGQEAEN